MKEYLPYIVKLLLGGGLLSGLYMLLKIRVEAGQITVTAAQGALIVQTGVIDSLREDLASIRAELKDVRRDLHKSMEENIQLRARIRVLENK